MDTGALSFLPETSQTSSPTMASSSAKCDICAWRGLMGYRAGSWSISASKMAVPVRGVRGRRAARPGTPGTGGSGPNRESLPPDRK